MRFGAKESRRRDGGEYCFASGGCSSNSFFLRRLGVRRDSWVLRIGVRARSVAVDRLRGDGVDGVDEGGTSNATPSMHGVLDCERVAIRRALGVECPGSSIVVGDESFW